MADTMTLAEAHLSAVLDRAERRDVPFRHWNLTDVLPDTMTNAFTAMPARVPDVGAGTRAAANSQRSFVSVENRQKFWFCADLADALQSPRLTSALAQLCNVDLAGSFLRIEFCQDREGFWLEPHTDIGAKLFTAQIYLSTHAGAENMGTDFLDADGNLVIRTEGAFNTGHIFIPASDTWHSFGKRPFDGVRRSLIVNYVRPEWMARHELAFPDEPVRLN